MAKDDNDRIENKVFGDMDPAPGTTDHIPEGTGSDDEDLAESDPNERPGSRDVTGGGGAGTETGGTRNYRQTSGASGGDVGNRPEVYKPK